MAKSKRRSSLADVPAPAGVETRKPSKEDVERERRYRAQNAMETLLRAEEHRADPKLMADVKRLAADMALKAAKVAKGK